MAIAENVARWYDERKRSEDWVKWTRENEEAATALTVAHDLAKQYGMLKE